MNKITLASMAIAVAATSATAQSNRALNYHDFAKPYVAKTNPAVPLAPATNPAQPSPTIQLTTTNPSLVDGCVLEALGRLPKVEGARVASAKPEFHHSANLSGGLTLEFWDVFVTVDFNGRPVNYTYSCRVTPAHGTAELIKRPD